MKKTSVFLAFLIFFTAFLWSAGQKDTVISEEQSDSTRTVIDMEGNIVTLPLKGATFGIFGGPVSQVPYILGAQDSIVAVTKGPQMMELMKAIDPGIVDKPAPRTTNGNINIESLIAANPDCVIAFSTDGEIVKKHTNIPVIVLSGTMSDGVEEMRKEIAFFGEVFQKQKSAEQYISYLDKTLSFLAERVGDIPLDDRKSIFVAEGASHLQTLGGDTFISEWMEYAGCRNAIKDIETTQGQHEGMHSGFMEISMEQVLKGNPDILIIDQGTVEDLESDPRWKEIAAVKNGMVFSVPSGVFLWSRPSLESAVLYPLWMAFHAYPEKFQDVSLKDELKIFYRTIFKYEITNEQAAKIIGGKMGKVNFGKINK